MVVVVQKPQRKGWMCAAQVAHPVRQKKVAVSVVRRVERLLLEGSEAHARTAGRR